MSKPTREEMVSHLNLLNGGCMEGCLTCELYGDECNKIIQSIREALTERDKLFEEVHELKLELVGFKRKKLKVSRDRAFALFLLYSFTDFIEMLAELGIKIVEEDVSDER